MNNKEIAQVFQLTGKLLELHGDNPFKTKSYSNAAYKIGKMDRRLADMSAEELSQIQGFGKAIVSKIQEMTSTGNLEYLQKLIEKTPVGVIDMLSLKGVGPKKIRVLWKELGVESVGELLYACNENRLVDLKGFGAKTQEKIKKAIEFKNANAGKYHYAAVEEAALSLVEVIKKNLGTDLVKVTGALRRKCEVVDKIELLIGKNDRKLSAEDLNLDINIPVKFHYCAPEEFSYQLVKTTGNAQHLEQLTLDGLENAKTEEEIYAANQLPYVLPELREGEIELEWSRQHKIDELIQTDDLKGIVHVHTDWSDGMHSLQEMAEYCKSLGYEYLGISDHSKSAFYANGLNEERVLKQHEAIDACNEKLAPFKIFKGIESDILPDGSLDYAEDILKKFDFIVASVHSVLKMDREKATNRLVKAIENPYTTILGHMTGRLLLSREGYPLDHRKVIDACAANKVSIELNAHPYRLDIDWRWIPYALEKGIKISVNPDAHNKNGYSDVYYGTCVARKGGLTKDMTLNALPVKDFEVYLKQK